MSRAHEQSRAEQSRGRCTCASIDVTKDFTKILITREGGNHALARRGGAGAAAGRVGGWDAAHAGAIATRQTEQPTGSGGYGSGTGRRGVRRVGGAGSAGWRTSTTA
uniref:Uncharacterized protein n=1 Tax=Oryza barthii TaxID=65489 RepID=A0A0D3HSB2_9ORYZ